MIRDLGGGWLQFVFEETVEMPVFLVGDFNGWDETSHAMERHEDGTHRTILRLNPGEYEFKYKCGNVWFNDPRADKYVANCWGSENSVAVVPPYLEEEVVDPHLEERPVRRPRRRAKLPSRPSAIQPRI